MPQFKRYRLNPETLLYEIEKVSVKSRFLWTALVVASSLALSFGYFWLFTSVLGAELPKTTLLRKQNARWASKIDLLNRHMSQDETTLEGLEMRDNEIYRNIFGLNEISDETRSADAVGKDRYASLGSIPGGSTLQSAAERLDVIAKKTYVQGNSFDEIWNVSKKAGDMASCIPAIPPLVTDPSKYHLSSPFGYRTDPITGARKMHTGFDFSCHPGNPVYATGDGTVESVTNDLFGYGNSVTINHGFGYKTRYAHLKYAYVGEGMKLKRGECIGETGNSGRSTGPHLHYEVMYREGYVNPTNYFDLNMPKAEYEEMVRKVAAESKNILVKPGTRIKR